MFLAVLTSGNQDFDVSLFPTNVIVIVCIVIILYAIFAVLSRQKSIFYIDTSYTGSLTGGLWKSLLALSAMLLMVCALGNTNEIFHYRLRIEHLLESNDYDDALSVGEKSDDTDPDLTMLIIYA